MITLEVQSKILQRLDEIRHLCPEMRLGQILSTIGMLGEDSTGRNLQDLEDDDFSDAVERFASDLARRAEKSDS